MAYRLTAIKGAGMPDFIGPFKTSKSFHTNWLLDKPLEVDDIEGAVELLSTQEPPDAVSLGGPFIAVSPRLSKTLTKLALGGLKYLPIDLRQSEQNGDVTYKYLLISSAPLQSRLIVARSKYKTDPEVVPGVVVRALVDLDGVVRKQGVGEPEVWREKKQTVDNVNHYATSMWPMVSDEAWQEIERGFPRNFWAQYVPEE